MRATCSQCRILALSATPGNDIKTISEVVQNLRICVFAASSLIDVTSRDSAFALSDFVAKMEVRDEEDADVKPYIHGRTMEVATSCHLAALRFCSHHSLLVCV